MLDESRNEPGDAAPDGRAQRRLLMFAVPARRGTPLPGIAGAAIPTPVLAALALVLAAAFWGTAFAAAKVVLVEVPPVTVAVLRCAIATVVLVPIACRGGARPAFGVQSALLGLT